MKRRTFFATIAAAFGAAKTTHTAFGGVPFNHVLAAGSLVVEGESLVLLPKANPECYIQDMTMLDPRAD